ncbi:hypothetical protein H1C71_041731 [Ictidomys tridecemlineatus]|nr:hypothetical protein H1C71_041731 [Ictidomys tridecemlineatus]
MATAPGQECAGQGHSLKAFPPTMLGTPGPNTLLQNWHGPVNPVISAFCALSLALQHDTRFTRPTPNCAQRTLHSGASLQVEAPGQKEPGHGCNGCSHHLPPLSLTLGSCVWEAMSQGCPRRELKPPGNEPSKRLVIGGAVSRTDCPLYVNGD